MYDLVRSPLCKTASMLIGGIFACYTALLYLLGTRPYFVGGCWGPPSSDVFTATYGPWFVVVSGLYLLAYGAVYLFTAVMDWRSQSMTA